MKISWITVQLQRLKELRAAQEELELDFESTNERDDTFQKLIKKLVRLNKDQLAKIRMGYRQALLPSLENGLSAMLREHGFVQVVTPLILSKGHLAKMSITEEHPLFKQVFWIYPKYWPQLKLF